MFIVFIKMKLFPEKEKEFLQTIQAISERIKMAKDCLNFHMYDEVGRKSTYCLVEEWRTQKALDHHMKSDTFSVLMGALNLLSEKPSITVSKCIDIINEDIMEMSDRDHRIAAVR